MSINTLIQISVPSTIIDARLGTGVSPTFVLPVRTTILTWQTSFDVNPSVVNITLQVSIDGISWTTIDTTTAVGGETRVISAATSATFIRANVVTNTGNRHVTVLLVAKVFLSAVLSNPFNQSLDTTNDVQFNSLNLTDIAAPSGLSYKLVIDDNGDITSVVDSGGGGSLDDLTDVTLTSPTDGQILTFDNGSSKWINSSGSNPFDQELNTTNDVVFNSISGQVGTNFSIIGDISVDINAPVLNTAAVSALGGLSFFYQLDISDSIVMELLAAPSGQTYSLLINDTGTVSSGTRSPFDQTLNIADSVVFAGLTLSNLTAPSGETYKIVIDDTGVLSSVVDAGTNPFDQDLNTTDEVIFNGIAVGNNDIIKLATNGGYLQAENGGNFNIQQGDGVSNFGAVLNLTPTTVYLALNDATSQINLGATSANFKCDGGAISIQSGDFINLDPIAQFQINGTPGITDTVTTGSLVGKTITITKGIITGFA